MIRRVAAAGLLVFATKAHAVLVRGTVTTPLGAPLAAARVQLIRLDGGPRSVADAISGADGAYEIRTGLSGRFLVITSPSVLTAGYAPQIGFPFYGGRADILTLNVSLNTSVITPQASLLEGLIPSPLAELADPPAQVAGDQFLTQATVLPELRALPGSFVVQYGQLGAPASLYLRGAPVTNTLVDGVTAEDLGGRFNLSTLTSSGLAALAASPAVEVSPDANPLHFFDSQAGTLSFESPTGASVHPNLTLEGDAGNLSTVREEAIFSLAHTRSDVLASFSRLDTDNDLPAARLHLITSAANLGYHIAGATSLRATVREDVDSAPLSVPFGFYNLQPLGKQAAQNLYSSFAFDTRTIAGWHNQVRYGLARKRAEMFRFSTITAGLPVTITGANGYSVTGIASFTALPAREDFVTNRDEFSYQTDYGIAHWLTALATARYQDERGADLTAGARERVERCHLSVAGELVGEVKHRFFFEASGFIDNGALFGLRGSPSAGLTYAPVRPGARKFRGTTLHVTAAAGMRELSLTEQLALSANPSPPRSRTFDAAIDQEILPRKLSLHAGYFHNQFAHETEILGLAPVVLSGGLAYRTQGLESALTWQPFSRFQLRGGYSYLASLVEQSGALPIFNPAFAGAPIGALTALVGARPFHRPPNTGFATAEWTGKSIAATVKATFAGKSDDSTNLYLNANLLLPNRNLSPGFSSIDANVSYAFSRRLTLLTQFNNLTDCRQIAPIGYLSTPFAVRIGLRLRLGRE